jgi:oxygen-independent coproporphyrinogen-3 oxidase
LSSVFFGGGTPSYVPAEGIADLCRGCRAAFDPAPDAEVTLEANPGDFSGRDLSAYLEAGVNRLSIGVQSLDDGLLAALGRRHDAAGAVAASRAARAAGFTNVSLDLMFGLPRQTMEQWQASVDGVLELEPDHLSLYALTLEPGTPMEAAVRSGETPAPDADLAADMYLLAEETLGAAGFKRYEISNWALPGRESRHNLAYWLNQPYLGVGAGAHSYLPDRRLANALSPRGYTERLAAGGQAAAGAADAIAEMRRVGAVESVENVTPNMELADTAMMGLRLERGLQADEFRERFGLTLQEAFGGVIDETTAAGLLLSNKTGIRLSGRGHLLGNEVFERFVSRAREVELPASARQDPAGSAVRR